MILLGHRFTKNSVPKDKKLSVISRFGVGYDSVDLDACNDNSIALVITPDGIRRPVAVSVMAFILSLTGNMFIKDKITRNGEWDSRSEYMGKGIVDKTLGFIGFGNIGAEIVNLAKVFDMNFIAYDPYADKKNINIYRVNSDAIEKIAIENLEELDNIKAFDEDRLVFGTNKFNKIIRVFKRSTDKISIYYCLIIYQTANLNTIIIIINRNIVDIIKFRF